MSVPFAKDLFSFENTVAAPLFENVRYPFEVLDRIGEFIIQLGKSLPKDEYYSPKENVYISKGATVYQSAYIDGPCIIECGAEIRHCAFIRGNAIIGKNAVVGNSTEIKNAILFDCVQVPHYNYVGDSILGYKSHLGAGAVTSNVKSDKTLVIVKSDNSEIQTGRKKVGAMVGDFAEIGCGSVLCPGTVIGKNTNVYPLSMVRGVVLPNSIYKNAGEIVNKR